MTGGMVGDNSGEVEELSSQRGVELQRERNAVSLEKVLY